MSTKPIGNHALYFDVWMIKLSKCQLSVKVLKIANFYERSHLSIFG